MLDPTFVLMEALTRGLSRETYCLDEDKEQAVSSCSKQYAVVFHFPHPRH